MENRLKGLRQSMKKTTFKELQFTEQHQQAVLDRINKQKESDEEVIFAILQLLVNEKTGYELAKLLRGRGIQKFEDNEGFLYTFIHRLEQNNYLLARWDESGAKWYQLNDKGRKILQKAEKKQTKKQLILKGLLEG